MRHRSSVETRWCPLLSILVLEVLQIVSACSDNSVSRVRLKLEDPKEKKVAKATLSAAPPVCPAAGLAPLQPLPYKTGHHKVTLTWHASVPPTNPNLTAVGYCLYRSKKKNVARKSATCSDCERVTPTPIARTGCVDDLVENGATYYYVATAIAPGGQLSSSSNEITVAIPPTKQSLGPLANSSYPPCRAPGSDQSPSTAGRQGH